MNLIQSFFVMTTCGTVSVMAMNDPVSHIENELQKGSKNIVVPAGVYRLKPRGDVYLKLEKLEGVTIDFSGVEFIGPANRMIEINDCTDLTLKGLTIDYDPLPFTQARIVDRDEDGNWNVKVIEGYPAKDVPERDNEFWPIQVYGKDTLELVNPMRFRDNIAVERTGADTYRITGGIDRRGEVGDIAVFSWRNGGSGCAVYSRQCVRLRIEDFTVYSTPYGGAFIGSNNNRTTYINCRLDRRPPETDPVTRGLKRLRSGNHDAFIEKDAYGGPTFISCTARYHCDDCINISGTYNIVTQVSGRDLRVLIDPRGVCTDVGDTVQIMTYDGQCPPDARVLALSPDGERTEEEAALMESLGLTHGLQHRRRRAYRITLDREVPMEKGSVIMSNNRCGSGFVIKDCTFGHNRSRGLLIKASDGVIENNTIEDCWASGMQVSTEYQWMSGGCSSNLRITGNRLSGNRGWGIGISGQSGNNSPLSADSHRNMVVNGNVITGPKLGVKVEGCTGLDIRDNHITLTSDEEGHGLLLQTVKDVTQADNDITTKP